ncbi:MAG: hypothetical protein V1716_00725 [Candidatus Uhrbacteria bacterium]
MSAYRFFAFVVLAATALLVSFSAEAKDVAVVVGISPPTIPQVVSHAAEVAAELREGGYEVHELVDEAATKAAIEAVFAATLPQELATGDCDKVLVFISCPVIGGDAEDPWLIPWGTELTGSGIEAGGIQMSGLVEVIKNNVPDTVSLIVVTDTTHTGTVDGLLLIGPDAQIWNGLTNTFVIAPALDFVPVSVPGIAQPVFGVVVTAGLGGEADLDGNRTISSVELERFIVNELGAEAISVSSTLGSEKVLLVLSPSTAAIPLDIPSPRPTEEKQLHRPLAISLLVTSALLAGGSTATYFAGKPLLEDPVADDEGRYRTLRGLNLGLAGASVVTTAAAAAVFTKKF